MQAHMSFGSGDFSEIISFSDEEPNREVDCYADKFELKRVIPNHINIGVIMKQMNLWNDKTELYEDSKICISGEFPTSTTEESIKSNESPKRSKRIRAKLLISSTPIATIQPTKKDFEKTQESVMEVSNISKTSSEEFFEKDSAYQTSSQRRYYNTKRKLRLATKKFEIDDYLAEREYQELVSKRNSKKCLDAA